MAWRVATAPMKGVSCAYAPASSRHSTSRPMIRPASSTALRIRTTEFSRGLAVASSSARELTIFTGRPDFRASRQAKCSKRDVELPAEPAADGGGGDPHLRLREAEHRAEGGAHAERVLRARGHVEAAVLVHDREAGAGFDVALVDARRGVLALDDQRRPGEGRRHVAGLDDGPPAQVALALGVDAQLVVRQVRMHEGRAGLERRPPGRTPRARARCRRRRPPRRGPRSPRPGRRQPPTARRRTGRRRRRAAAGP